MFCSVLDAEDARIGEGDRRGRHLLRHTVASSMVPAGVDRSDIAATLGHEGARTKERYAFADIEGLRRRSARLLAREIGLPLAA